MDSLQGLPFPDMRLEIAGSPLYKNISLWKNKFLNAKFENTRYCGCHFYEKNMASRYSPLLIYYQLPQYCEINCTILLLKKSILFL